MGSKKRELALRLGIESVDDEVFGHMLRTGRLARLTALRMGLGKRRSAEIAEAAYLHDAGKLVMDRELVSKPGPLSASEREVMRTHPLVGSRLLESRGFSPLAAAVALHHHERYDGRGYPHGIRGASIPLEARITSVADVYDAMVSLRIYSPPVPHEEAAAEIERCSGTQFDPDAAAALLAALRDGAAL